MGNSKFYVTCPCCGRRLCKAVPGSEVEQDCPKCQNTILIFVDEEKAVTTKVLIERPVNAK